MPYDLLPGIRVSWSTYGGSDTFIDYKVYRRALVTILDEHETTALTIAAPQTLLPTTDMFSGYQGAIAIRGSFPWDNSSEPGATMTIFEWFEDADNSIRLDYIGASNSFVLRREVATTVTTATIAQSVTVDAQVTLIARWTATGIGLSYNGSDFTTTVTTSGAISSTNDLMDIGTAQGVDESDIEIDWLVAFAGTLTNADTDLIHAWSDSEWGEYAPSLEGFRDLDTNVAIPTGLWANLETTAYKVIPSSWTTIAAITDEARLYYNDRRVFSRKYYQYAVTVEANVFGDVIESDKQDPPSTDSVTFSGVVLHRVDDETDYGIFSANVMQTTPQQQKAYVQARGRTKRTAQFGELEDSTIHIEPVMHLYTDRQDWEALRKFLTRQREEAAIYQVRPGHVPEGYFAQIDSLSRSDIPNTWQSGIDLQEVYFDEEAT